MPAATIDYSDESTRMNQLVQRMLVEEASQFTSWRRTGALMSLGTPLCTLGRNWSLKQSEPTSNNKLVTYRIGAG
jgi:hypothetical protein